MHSLLSNVLGRSLAGGLPGKVSGMGKSYLLERKLEFAARIMCGDPVIQRIFSGKVRYHADGAVMRSSHGFPEQLMGESLQRASRLQA